MAERQSGGLQARQPGAPAVAAERPPSPLERIQGKGMLEEISKSLPSGSGIDPQRIARLAVTTIRRSANARGENKLLDAVQSNPLSFFGAVMESSAYGLEIGVAGQAYLVPYKGEVQLQLGYRGMVSLAYRSDQVVGISTGVVYENDTEAHGGVWHYLDGSKPICEFRQADLPDEKRGAVLGAFAVVRLRNGGHVQTWMSESQIDAIRRRSPSANSPAWRDDTDEMRKKTVLKRALKLCPIGTTFSRAIEVDDLHDAARRQGLRFDPANPDGIQDAEITEPAAAAAPPAAEPPTPEPKPDASPAPPAAPEAAPEPPPQPQEQPQAAEEPPQAAPTEKPPGPPSQRSAPPARSKPPARQKPSAPAAPKGDGKFDGF